MKNIHLLAGVVVACGWAASAATAAVTHGEAEQLGQSLTPVGAEWVGNGSDIPAWDGGLDQNLDGIRSGFHADPFQADAPVMRITADNMDSHLERLTAGQQALLKQYPSFYLEIYPSRRSASYPEYVYQALQDNARNSTLLPFGSGVSGTVMSSPFPIPDNGLEVLWNHTLRFRGHSLSYSAVSSVVTDTGQRMDTLRDYRVFVNYSEPDLAPEEVDNKIFMMTRKTLEPSSQSGRVVLVHETMDQISSPRKSWLYVPGQRRLRRTPDLAYDTPDPNNQSLRTIDQVDMFNGAPDHYDWVLLGKQEKYIPYNAYALHQGNVDLDEVLKKRHLNPSLLRYEPHRVWVIEATLRLGYQHKYAKRRYYLDEDSWSIVYAEEYDQSGDLLQVSEAHLINYFEVPLMYPTLEVTYDLQSGFYYAEGLDNERQQTISFADNGLRERDFSTSAIRRSVKR